MQLDEPVAIDDLAGSYRDIAANDEILGADRLLAADGALPILHEILQALSPD